MKVKYELRKTSLGQGVFLLEPLKQGSLIWRCRDTIGQLICILHAWRRIKGKEHIIRTNLCGVRYRKDENVVCFNGKEETLAHLEKLSSYEDRLPLFVV